MKQIRLFQLNLTSSGEFEALKQRGDGPRAIMLDQGFAGWTPIHWTPIGSSFQVLMVRDKPTDVQGVDFANYWLETQESP